MIALLIKAIIRNTNRNTNKLQIPSVSMFGGVLTVPNIQIKKHFGLCLVKKLRENSLYN